MLRPYTVITQHGVDRTVRRTRFADFDSALAFAKATDPDTDGSLCPNVDEKFYVENYTDPVRWFGNTYAIIVKKVTQ